MSEPRLPFPVHGTRQAGDERPAGALGDAARLLYFTNLIADTAGVPTYQMQRQTPYGAVTASVNGPLAFKGVRAAEVEPEPDPLPEPEPTLGPARLVWLPEGFVITPRTPGSPLCRAHAEDAAFDGLEIALKGGQIGGDAYFLDIRDGKA